MQGPSALSADVLLLIAVGVVGVAYLAAVYLRGRGPRALFLVGVAQFAAISGVLLALRIEPYAPSRIRMPFERRFLEGAIEIVWWLSAAWLAGRFVRALASLGRGPREAKLVKDLAVGLVFALAAFAIAANVFNLPIKGLLATSGVVAIVIGLALQNSLSDLFSGIVLDIERPCQIGDWVIVDQSVEGQVLDMTWRAARILTASHDVVIVPNSVVAKLKIVNCSAPTRRHGVTMSVRLKPTIPPADGCQLLKAVLLGVGRILSAPAPTVSVKDVSAEGIEFELVYSVADIQDVEAARTAVFERLYRVAAGGAIGFAPRLASLAAAAAPGQGVAEPGPPPGPSVASEESLPQDLICGMEVFSGLTDDEKRALVARAARRVYGSGARICAPGAVSNAFHILASGVLMAWSERDGVRRELLGLVPGDHFGELGVLTGARVQAEITALTPVVLYELPPDALSPVLERLPALAEQLGRSLVARRLTSPAPQEANDDGPVGAERLAKRLALAIRRLFSR